VKPEHWRRHPEDNIGIATGRPSGVDVLDVDVDKDGLGTFRDLRQRYGEPEKTALVQTGSGGYHLFFDHVGAVANSQGRLGAGLDVRGDGGYVVAPPSLHRSGRRYRWVRPPWDDCTPKPPPDWLAALMRPPPPRTVVPFLPDDVPPDEKLQRCRRYVARMPPAISEAGGHNATFAVALKCVEFDLDPDRALQVLRVFNQRCVPPWTERDLEHKVKQAYEKGRVGRGVKL
jgi:hypothetical protein